MGSEDLKKELSRWNSVENLTDQKLLFKIAKTDKNIFVRQSAIRTLKDQTLLEKLLEEIIKTKDDSSLISTVVCNPNFTNQKLLERIIMTTKNWCTCMFAIQNPNFLDQKLLAEIALNIEFFPIRKAAIAKITDQSILVEIAKKADENTLFDVVYNPNFIDQTLLTETVKTKKDYLLRSIAIKKINDCKLLMEIINNTSEHWSVRSAAISAPNVVDKKLLEQIACSDKDYYVRSAAVKKITNQEILAQIAKNDKKKEVRCAAINNHNLVNSELFTEIAKNDKTTEARNAALERLQIST